MVAAAAQPRPFCHLSHQRLLHWLVAVYTTLPACLTSLPARSYVSCVASYLAARNALMNATISTSIFFFFLDIFLLAIPCFCFYHLHMLSLPFLRYAICLLFSATHRLALNRFAHIWLRSGVTCLAFRQRGSRFDALTDVGVANSFAPSFVTVAVAGCAAT